MVGASKEHTENYIVLYHFAPFGIIDNGTFFEVSVFLYNPTGGMITRRLLIRTQMVKGPIYFLGMPGIQNIFFFHGKNLQINHTQFTTHMHL